MNLENLPLIIYLVDTFTVNGGMQTLGFLTFVYYAGFNIILSAMIAEGKADESNKEATLKSFKVGAVGYLCAFLITYSFIVPGKNTAYKILAVHYGVQVVDTEFAGEVSTTSKKALNALNRILDEYAEKGEK